jgi:OFA family oxalate/formate antiporter-like MFS transporter
VYVPALEKEFGWTRTQTSLVATIDMVMLASMFLVAGFMQRRFGSQLNALIGGTLFSLGLFLASYTTSLPMLYLTWGVMLGAGLGVGYSAPIAAGSRWYPDHLGIVNGLAIGIFAAGSGICGPIAAKLIESIGWRDTFRVLAGVFFAFCMIGTYLLKDPPAGYKAPAPKHSAARAKRLPMVDVETGTVLRTAVFRNLWIAYALGATAGTMVISQLVPFARGAGWDASTAAAAISVGAAGSALGRFFSGWMSDHLGRLLTLRMMVVVSMVATPLLYIERENLVAFMTLLFVVYYCYGTQLSVYTALAGDFWGVKYLSTNYGLLLLAWGFAGVMGPQIGSRVFVWTGTYQYAFLGAGVMAAIALAVLALVSQPTLKPAGQHT